MCLKNTDGDVLSTLKLFILPYEQTTMLQKLSAAECRWHADKSDIRLKTVITLHNHTISINVARV